MVAEVELVRVPEARRPFSPRGRSLGGWVLSLVSTTDHKIIGQMYLVTTFGFFVIGGLLALLLRAELAAPGLQFLSNEQYNQLFTVHGTLMLLLYATPWCSASPMSFCRCRSAHPTSRSPGSTRSRTGCFCSAD